MRPSSKERQRESCSTHNPACQRSWVQRSPCNGNGNGKRNNAQILARGRNPGRRAPPRPLRLSSVSPPPPVPRCAPRRSGPPLTPPKCNPRSRRRKFVPVSPPSPRSDSDSSDSSWSPGTSDYSTSTDNDTDYEEKSEEDSDSGSSGVDRSSALPIVQKPKKKENALRKDITDTKSTVLAQRIINEMLTLRCPLRTCRQAFVDFDGCFSLQCHRCETYFCAWCLAFCHRLENTVTNHRKECSEATHPGVFHTLDVFEEHHRNRKRNMLVNILAHESEKVRSATLRKLTKNLEHLDISPSDLEDK